MRTLLLTTAAALFLCAGTANAQAKTTTTSPTKPMVTTPTSSASSIDEQKRSISKELKGTLSTVDAMLPKAMSLVTGAKPEDHDRFMKIADGIKNIQSELTNQLGLVGKATEKNSKEVFAKATETNLNSVKALEAYKTEMVPPIAK